MTRPARPGGFTLIELLVVITMIVILLALLTPALDKAIYQAELTICAAQQRAVAAGVVAYAAENARHYPNPPAGRSTGHQVEQLGSWGADQEFMLPLLEPYMGRDIFVCPLIGDVSYDPQDNVGLPGRPTILFSTYGLWFATRFSDPAARAASARGRYRVGDRLEYVDKNGPDPSNPRLLRIGVMIGDLNCINDNDTGFSTHADRDGVYINNPVQDKFNGINPVTYSRWVDNAPVAPVRGLLDLNFTYDDLHVDRLEDLRFKHEEPRTYATPHHVTGANGQWQEYIPE